ncbi:MAG: peptidase T [Spirochaetales bacterium]|nr:peptidase T [Spirochaetales bacterium]
MKNDNYKDLLEDFLRYTKIDTKVSHDNEEVPSSPGQNSLAKLLHQEMTDLGLSELFLLDNAICGGQLPGNNSSLEKVTLFAHLDTAADLPGNTKARIIENYPGGDVSLNEKSSILVSENSELSNYVGDTLIVTSGDTLLGADDKIAIAEVMALVKYLKNNDEIPHGDIQIIFVPDEEKGLVGAKALDMSLVRGSYGVCLDCCGIGEYVIENWWAGEALVTFRGVTAHPMSAKGKMVNSILQAQEYIQGLPETERPEHTEKKEGFFYLSNLNGSTVETTAKIHVRDFDKESYENRKKMLFELALKFKNCTIEYTERYGDCAKALSENPKLLKTVREGMEALEIKGIPLSMRGGYDGSALGMKGLPTLNIFTGAHNFHSAQEYLPLRSAEKAVDLLLYLVTHI